MKKILLGLSLIGLCILADSTPRFVRCESRGQVQSLTGVNDDTIALVIANTSPNQMETFKWFGNYGGSADGSNVLSSTTLSGKWIRVATSGSELGSFSSTIKIQGATADSTSYQLIGYNSNGALSTRLDNAGRLDLYDNGTAGGIAVLGLKELNPPTNRRAGHYAFTMYDGSGAAQQNTISLIEAAQTATATNALYSRIALLWMEGVNDSPGGTYAYQQPNKSVIFSSAGMVMSNSITLGTNAATVGAINLPNNWGIWARNAANSTDIRMGQVLSDNILYMGGNATAISLQVPVYVGLQGTGVSTPTVSSSSTIAPTTRIVIVSGTSTINTITAPSPISSFGGQITLIPTGAFTTGTSGNIALASTAVVNKALIMTYDASTTKWYPSY